MLRPDVVRRYKSLQPPMVTPSYFSYCDRDATGHCKPEGGAEESGGNNRSRKQENDAPKMMREMFARIGKPDGGFTYHHLTDSEPSKGFALSIYPEISFAKKADDLTLQELVSYINKNKDLLDKEENYLGGWHDPASGMAFLDVTMVSQDEAKAKELALKHNLIGYFDLEKLQWITVNKEVTSDGKVSKKSLGVQHGRGKRTGTASGKYQRNHL